MNTQQAIVTEFVGDPNVHQLAVHVPTRSIALLLPAAVKFAGSRTAYALVPLRACTMSSGCDDIRLIKDRVDIESPFISYVPMSRGGGWKARISFTIEVKYSDPCDMFSRAVDDISVRDRIREDACVYNVPRVYADIDTVHAFRREVRGAKCATVRTLEEYERETWRKANEHSTGV